MRMVARTPMRSAAADIPCPDVAGARSGVVVSCIQRTRRVRFARPGSVEREEHGFGYATGGDATLAARDHPALLPDPPSDPPGQPRQAARAARLPPQHRA